MSHEHESHGHSVAAWVCVTLLIIGFALGSLAVALLNVPLAIGGVIVCIIGLVAGKVLAARGYGLAGQQGAGH